MDPRSAAARAWHRLPPVRRLVAERDQLRTELDQATRKVKALQPDPGDYGYLFIVTYGRSGSTLLNGLLNSIPGYLIRGENGMVVHYLLKWDQTIRERQESNPNMRRGPRGSWFGLSDYPRDVALDQMRQLVLTTLLRPGPRAKVLGFKEIRWPVKGTEDLVAFLSELFPGARFLFNTRNPEDVAKSEWWANAKNPVEQIANRENAWASIREELGDRAFSVHYDDYVADVEALRPAWEWLGEPFDRDALQQVLDTKHGY